MCYNADNIVCWPIYRPLYFAAFYEVEHCNKHYLGDLVAVRLLGLELPSSSPSSAQLLSPVPRSVFTAAWRWWWVLEGVRCSDKIPSMFSETPATIKPTFGVVRQWRLRTGLVWRLQKMENWESMYLHWHLFWVWYPIDNSSILYDKWSELFVLNWAKNRWRHFWRPLISQFLCVVRF